MIIYCDLNVIKQPESSISIFVPGDCYGALFQGVDPGEEDDDDEFEFFEF